MESQEVGNFDKRSVANSAHKKSKSVTYSHPSITSYLPTIASNFLIWPVVDKSAGDMVVVNKGLAGALLTKQ
jgi:hypothetical protein